MESNVQELWASHGDQQKYSRTLPKMLDHGMIREPPFAVSHLTVLQQ